MNSFWDVPGSICRRSARSVPKSLNTPPLPPFRPIHLKIITLRRKNPKRPAKTKNLQHSEATTVHPPIHYPIRSRSTHDRHPPGRFYCQRRRRAAIHQLLPSRRLHHQPGQGLRARTVPRRQGRHRADPHQQPHVRRGPSPHLPGHRHRQRLRQARHECPL